MTTDYLEKGESILTNFIKQYYSGTPFVPKEILLSNELEEADILAEWLSKVKGSKVRILTPKRVKRKK